MCNIRPSSSCFNGHGAQSFQKGHAVVNLAEQSRLETKRCSFRREVPRRNVLCVENSRFFLLYYNFVHLLYHQTYNHIYIYYNNIRYIYMRVEQKVHERGFLCVSLWVCSEQSRLIFFLKWRKFFFWRKFWRKFMYTCLILHCRYLYLVLIMYICIIL